VDLVEGQIYCLPSGEKVTARLLEGTFILEFKRQYRTPLSVHVDGTLLLRGESTGLTVSSLAPAAPSRGADTETD
jgi:hypothetical protein